MFSTVEKKIGFFILCNNDYSSVHKFDYRIQKSNTVRPTLYIPLLSGFFFTINQILSDFKLFPNHFLYRHCFFIKKDNSLCFSRLYQIAHGGCDRLAEDGFSSTAPDHTFNFCKDRVYSAPVLYFYCGLVILNTARYQHISSLKRQLIIGFIFLRLLHTSL